nr:hypothetical protein [Cressdnaviricota sp.]
MSFDKMRPPGGALILNGVAAIVLPATSVPRRYMLHICCTNYSMDKTTFSSSDGATRSKAIPIPSSSESSESSVSTQDCWSSSDPESDGEAGEVGGVQVQGTPLQLPVRLVRDRPRSRSIDWDQSLREGSHGYIGGRHPVFANWQPDHAYVPPSERLRPQYWVCMGCACANHRRLPPPGDYLRGLGSSTWHQYTG